MDRIPSRWKPQAQRQSRGSSGAASAGANEYTEKVAPPGALHSMGVPQWMGAAGGAAATAVSANLAAARPGRRISNIVSKHTYK